MIRMFFGRPGCGKTTLAVRELVKDRDHRYTYCNFECDHPLIYDKFNPTVNGRSLGNWSLPEKSLVAIDEASCEWNNRSFKTFPPELIEYLKKHRHFKVDIDLYSQSWDDVDITARRLVEELWYIRKIGLGLSIARRIWKTVDIEKRDKEAKIGQIVDGYKKASIFNIFIKSKRQRTWKLYFRPHWYGFFNSWEKIKLPILFAEAVPRHVRSRALGKVVFDWFISVHRKWELLKCKFYCLRYDIDLDIAK